MQEFEDKKRQWEEEAEAKTAKKRPRIDMAVEPRERKRGKTMFGLVLGTLTKAKNEDKERNASDAVRLSLQCVVENADVLCLLYVFRITCAGHADPVGNAGLLVWTGHAG